MAEEKENFDTEEKKTKQTDSPSEQADSQSEQEETPSEHKDGSDQENSHSERSEESSPNQEDNPSGQTDSNSERSEESSPNGAEEKAVKKKKKPFKKKDPRDEKIEELTDKVKRQLAEFENFRTRSEKEKQQRYDMGASFIIEKMLPVLDNFERGLVDAPDDAFAEGMKMIHKQMLTALEEAGVKPIEALGKEFDPEYHNAVMQAEATDEYPSGTVAQELQKGYTYHDTVVRHSMVAVSQ